MRDDSASAGAGQAQLETVWSGYHKGLKRKLWNRLPWNPLLPAIFAAAVVFMGLAAPWFAPYSPTRGSLPDRLLPPAWVAGGSQQHLLGTDSLGRDNLSRLIWGARVSLLISFITIFLSGSVGTLVGLVSGYFGGLVDVVLMRLVDIGLSFPLILMAIILAAVLGPSFTNVILVIALLLWPRYARQVRGETLSVKEQDFVVLAQTMGCSPYRVLTRHVLPNIMPSLLVLATLQVGYVILLEASLSFLGVGIPPPQPAWGLMVSDGRAMVTTAWWVSLFPGLAILLTVVSLNLLGDWLRDRLDPKLRQV